MKEKLKKMLKALWSKPVLAAVIIAFWPALWVMNCRPMMLTAWPACSEQPVANRFLPNSGRGGK